MLQQEVNGQLFGLILGIAVLFQGRIRLTLLCFYGITRREQVLFLLRQLFAMNFLLVPKTVMFTV
jgi:hypothetical protein